ncbi:MAG: ATP-binding protein [Methylicorpusculum sp.]|uniref:ATP-binding protein n=1 Tax=Methylicorpusculum sp. TaxID=2713644 RepID=UPI00271AC163|nr:ATP-binding protein [Methylicorpusculum sp.]MDO8937806.1 ATP-binding protein [Methylicorpusculum sp.]MDP2203278.1 ATP-binding protein [Methylicorpusculum sp.]
MKLDKLILVNWGALRSDEYEMGNMTLLTGPTGSGKSTLLDALQTVMTAAHQNIYSYNPGQDETKQTSRGSKSKRTLWSYIAGAEDNLFARPDGAHGYVAAVFKPDSGEVGKPFTALIGAAVRVDGSGDRRQAVQERLALLLIDDAELGLSDLVNYDGSDNMCVVEVEKVENHLKARYAQVLNLRDAKREYLCQLYGRFRGQRNVSFSEAELAAKAWSQSIAHKPIGSVDDLVKTQILEYDLQQLPQRISQISGLMRQVHQLRIEGDRLQANVVRLESIEKTLTKANTAYETAVQYQLAHSQRALQGDLLQIQQAKAAVAGLDKNIQDANARIEGLNRDKKAYVESQIQLAARLSGIAAADQKRRITERLESVRLEAKAAIGNLQKALQQAGHLQSAAQAIAGMAFPASKRELSVAAELLAEVMAAIGHTPCRQLEQQLLAGQDPREVLVTVRALEGLNEGFGRLYQALTGTRNSFVATVQSQLAQLQTRLDEAQDREKILAQRKANLAEGGADYPREITQALKAFRAELPAARAQVLCDLIEPRDKSWQPAIEGYIVGARFNFVVDEDWEARAIEFVRKQHLRAKVIQGSLCKRNAKPERVPQDSIIHELHTEHPLAYAYLVEQYGQVVKVDNVEQLRVTPRGLMKDGKAAGSRTLFTGDADALVFGKEAQRQARQNALEAHGKAEQELLVLQDEGMQLNELLDSLHDLKEPDFADTAKLEQTVHDSQAVQADLARLDLTEVDQLEAEKDTLEQLITDLEKQVKVGDQEVGKYLEAKKQQLNRSALLEQGLPDRQKQIDRGLQPIKWICSVNESQSLTALLQAVDTIVESSPFSNDELQAEHTAKLIEANSAYSKLHEKIAEYNQHARSHEQLQLQYDSELRDTDFTGHYRQLVHLFERLKEQLREQREIGFIKNLDKLRTAESSFKDVFTKQFCYEIRNAVDQGVSTLKILNAELNRLKFGTDRFQLDWSVWVPEFKEYYDFFCAAYDMSESQESGDLFDTSELSPEQCKIRDRLVGFLLSDDQERALKELQRIADYRNYRRYEIWKDSDSGSRVALSEWGTGSGGQLETPAYIVRAAVVTNRLKHFDKGMNLKLLVNDESFAKMDERRAHDVIRFIRDSLGMQLICAMPTKHAGAIKTEFTKEWSFTRTEAEGNGEVDFISESDERDLNPDKLRELWEYRRQQVRQQTRLEFEAEEKM